MTFAGDNDNRVSYEPLSLAKAFSSNGPHKDSSGLANKVLGLFVGMKSSFVVKAGVPRAQSFSW